MSRAALFIALASTSLFAAACGKGAPEDSYARGHGLQVANVSTDAEAQIVDAAIHAAFDVEPALILRMHPLRLPRTAGDSGGTPVPPALVKALDATGLVHGVCTPVRSSPKNTPHCNTADAGYIIRTSDVLAMKGDSLEIYFAAEKYGASTGVKPEALRFEKIYQLVKSGARWRVAREGRVHP